MPDWLTIVLAILGVIGTLFGAVGVTAYLQERAKHKAAKKNKQEDKDEQAEEEKEKKLKEVMEQEFIDKISEQAMKDIIPEVMHQLNELLDAKLEPLKKGVQATCRNDLEDMYKAAEKEGYCPGEGKQRFEQTYQAYHSLGKNGVMDAKRDRLLAMPDSKPVKRRKLNESK